MTMTPDDLRALADALSSGTHYVESPELHEAMIRAADYLRAQADAQPVAVPAGWRLVPVDIDLDAVAMQQMRQAAAESTWMPAEYSGSDWISDVCRWLRDGPPQPEPKRPAFLDEIDRAKEHVASWPQWMKDATVSAAATLPVTGPKREPLSDWRIGELHRQWLANPETVTIADLMRARQHAHGIGGSDAE